MKKLIIVILISLSATVFSQEFSSPKLYPIENHAKPQKEYFFPTPINIFKIEDENTPISSEMTVKKWQSHKMKCKIKGSEPWVLVKIAAASAKPNDFLSKIC